MLAIQLSRFMGGVVTHEPSILWQDAVILVELRVKGSRQELRKLRLTMTPLSWSSCWWAFAIVLTFMLRAGVTVTAGVGPSSGAVTVPIQKSGLEVGLMRISMSGVLRTRSGSGRGLAEMMGVVRNRTKRRN